MKRKLEQTVLKLSERLRYVDSKRTTVLEREGERERDAKRASFFLSLFIYSYCHRRLRQH